jgi:hypothetical protein
MYKDINRTVPSPSARIPWFLISQFCRSHYANPFHLWSPFIIENAKSFLNFCQNVNLKTLFLLFSKLKSDFAKNSFSFKVNLPKIDN